jgi:hypothetical protein
VVTCEVAKIGPAMAAKMLEQVHPNRRIKPSVVERYRRQMAAGKWALNGESIVISDLDRVLDGQHRLSAIVESGVEIETVLVRGVLEEHFRTYDIGAGRSAADVFGMEGHGNSYQLAALLKLVWGYEKVPPGAAPRSGGATPELHETYRKYPGAGRSVAFCSRVSDICSTSLVAFVHLLGREYGNDAQATDQFVDSLVSGAGLAPTDPVWVLRERLRGLKGRGNRVEKLALAIKAYNAHIAGRPVALLSWSKSVRKREGFPMVVGDPRTREQTASSSLPAN